PILVTMMMGCFEAGRLILLHQKLDRAATSVADLVTQESSLTSAMLDEFYLAAERQTMPFDLPGDGHVIVSSVFQEDVDEEPQVRWQCDGGGALAGTSNVGTEDGDATMPSTFTLVQGENAIVAEVVYNYQPFLFDGIFEPHVLRHTSYTKPRLDDLLNKPTGC
ncbi:MAG: TadE/TadG family type IV pilus assembly protein, partial [Dongiaceae bacterium]